MDSLVVLIKYKEVYSAIVSAVSNVLFSFMCRTRKKSAED